MLHCLFEASGGVASRPARKGSTPVVCLARSGAQGAELRALEKKRIEPLLFYKYMVI